jgi:hypothetical protein
LFIKTIFQLVSDTVSKSYFSVRLSSTETFSNPDAVSDCDFFSACQKARLSQAPITFQMATFQRLSNRSSGSNPETVSGNDNQ